MAFTQHAGAKTTARGAIQAQKTGLEAEFAALDVAEDPLAV